MKHHHNTSEDSITFVARHFRPGAFSKRRALRAVMPGNILRPRWRTRAVAAAAAGVVLIAAASVAVFTRNAEPAPDVEQTATTVVTTPAPTDTVRLEFQAMPLREAVGKIEKAYGIELTGLPDNNPQVTLTFEGNAADLIEMLNASLDTRISIEE